MIAVIGGAGFVGSYIHKQISLDEANFFQSYDIDVTRNNNQQTFLDVEDVKTLDVLEGTDTIINLAAVHRDDVEPKSKYYDVNVNGAKNVCIVARKYKIKKIIFTSSVAIYGFALPDTDESGEPNYFNEYGRTKYLAEEIYKEWYAEDPDNRSLVIIRPTVIFGEGNRGNVYNLLKQIASKRFVMVGSGKNKKSMAYVENVAAFIRYSQSFGTGIHIYNYIDKPDFDMNTLVTEARKTLFGKNNIGLRLPPFLGMAVGYFADFFAKVTRKALPVSSIRVKKFMATTQFSSSVRDTGFLPSVSLEEGLARTLRYEFLEDNSNDRTFATE